MGLGIASYNVLYLYFGEIDGVEIFLEHLCLEDYGFSF
jgi:hypothetical protein